MSSAIPSRLPRMNLLHWGLSRCLNASSRASLLQAHLLGRPARQDIVLRCEPYRCKYSTSGRPVKKNPSRSARTGSEYQTPRALTQPSTAASTGSSTKGSQPVVWLLAGTLFAAAGGYSLIRLRQDDQQYDMPTISANQDPSERYHETAAGFDEDVESLERWSGMNLMRSRLARKASGHVLEVSAGTGRNTDYYDLKYCKSITFLDQAAEMTAISRRKFEETAKKKNRHYRNARFVTQSAMDSIEAPPGGFDTVLQTMGLCSTGDPVGLLKHLGQVVNQDSGRILLLEHGRSIFDFVNRRLDRSAPSHAAKYGCWWNRDIDKIVQESGLEIVKKKRYLIHFGTTYWYELRPVRTSKS